MSEESKIPAPLLSVCLITYNHAAYIRQAIEGVLMQKTTFDFDLFIADDCSTDGTRQILLEYKAKFPTKIHLILQETNVGPARNWIRLIESPTSKYIAYLEGDDYWTDAAKLQRQVDVLESRSDIVLVYHNTADQSEQGTILKYSDPLPTIQTFKDFTFCLYARSVSIVFRNQRKKLPIQFRTIKLGDWSFSLYLLENGNAFYIHDAMAVYRIHSNGAWNSTSPRENTKRVFETFLESREIFSKKFQEFIQERLFFLAPSYCKVTFLELELRKFWVGLRWFLASPISFKVLVLRRLLA